MLKNDGIDRKKDPESAVCLFFNGNRTLNTNIQFYRSFSTNFLIHINLIIDIHQQKQKKELEK